MDIKKRYTHIQSELKKTQAIWRKEVLEIPPSHWPIQFKDMVHEISKLSHYDKWRFLAQKDISSNPLKSGPLNQHLNTCQKLTQIPVKNYHQKIKLPSWAFKKVREKKQHEISILAQVLGEIRPALGTAKLIDIGGGQGHFARVMAYYFKWPTTSIDREEKFIQLGIKRLNKYPAPRDSAHISLKQLDFQGLETQDKVGLESLFQRDTFSLGLHTCGSLAVRHLQTHKKFESKGLLNFGCCYGKIKRRDDLNLSKLAKDYPIEWSVHALNLAARAHSQLSYSEFCLQERVKSYRYALHLFLSRYSPHKNYPSVGNAQSRNYLGSFCEYARLKFQYLDLPWTPSLKNELENFYYSYRTRQELEELFCADILRWSFGRLLELALLLDRALFLSEDNEQEVKLVEFFEEDISPRNIGILTY